MQELVILGCDIGIANCTNWIQSSFLRLHFRIQETHNRRLECILNRNAEQLRDLPALLITIWIKASDL